MQLLSTLHVCLVRASLLPVELRVIITNYSFYKITDENLERAMEQTGKNSILIYGEAKFWDLSELNKSNRLFCVFKQHNDILQTRL